MIYIKRTIQLSKCIPGNRSAAFITSNYPPYFQVFENLNFFYILYLVPVITRLVNVRSSLTEDEDFMRFKEVKDGKKDGVYIMDSAEIVGDVTIGENSSVWNKAVIRGDESSIRIGKNTNIQDMCVIHAEPNIPMEIGDNVTIGHSAVIHCRRVGSNCIIGMGAMLLNIRSTDIGGLFLHILSRHRARFTICLAKAYECEGCFPRVNTKYLSHGLLIK